MTVPLIRPDWPASGRIIAFTTTRAGGASAEPWASFNLGHHVGDDTAAVAANRQQLSSLLPSGSPVQWLSQVHGKRLVQASGAPGYPRADGCWSDTPGLACAVLTADCLPLLLCDRDASVVAAVHVGWRGLQAGIIEAALKALGVAPPRLMAWMGPAIGAAAFEVGPEVRTGFLNAMGDDVAGCFAPSPERPGHYLADLYGLARQRLWRAGVESVSGGGFCTYSEADRFFSYRRDGETGRMATVILIKGP